MSSPLEPITLCFPAEYLRYLQEEWVREKLRFPPPPRDCVAAIYCTWELYDEDCYVLYAEAETGKVLEKHTFRFPNLFTFGSDVDW